MSAWEWVSENPLLIFGIRKNLKKAGYTRKRERGVPMKKNVVSVVRAIAEPLAEELGYFVWDVEYVKEGSEMYLRITIDSEEGINIDDCEKMHRAIDPLLDEADPISEAYHLEVSSPGIERDLKNDMQIYACEGWDVEVRLYAPVDGAKSYLGVLEEPDEEGNIIITSEDGTQKKFARAAVASLRTYYDFSKDRD